MIYYWCHYIWAIVKDEGVYKKMEEYIQINTMGVSREAQLRALKLLNVVLEGNAKPFFQFGYATMRYRWTRLKQVLSLIVLPYRNYLVNIAHFTKHSNILHQPMHG
ncbi:hypothetical protein HN873_017493 [Arachis hypogaea]